MRHIRNRKTIFSWRPIGKVKKDFRTKRTTFKALTWYARPFNIHNPSEFQQNSYKILRLQKQLCEICIHKKEKTAVVYWLRLQNVNRTTRVRPQLETICLFTAAVNKGCLFPVQPMKFLTMDQFPPNNTIAPSEETYSSLRGDLSGISELARDNFTITISHYFPDPRKL